MTATTRSRIEDLIVAGALAVGALALGAAVLTAGGCAGKPVRPDDMSADAHRREASREQTIASRERAQFDPNARATLRISSPNDPVDAQRDYNPTESHLTEAQRHAAHAREHERAAAELERFEAAECAGVPARERAACPMIGPVALLEELPDGVRVQLADAARLPMVVAQMRCHLAFARTRGFERAPDCPLYLKGADIRASADARAVEIVAADRAVAREIAARAHELIH